MLRAPAPLHYRRLTPLDLTPARIRRGDQVEIHDPAPRKLPLAPLAHHPAVVAVTAAPRAPVTLAALGAAQTPDRDGAQHQGGGQFVQRIAARGGQFIGAALSAQPAVMRLAGVALVHLALTANHDTHPLDGRADEDGVGRAPASALDLDGR
ncbi:MAG: hypothetical protein EBR73_17695, partial [Rhodobacteraceae bacterium]|nr:hypothetical protein [Paracoccaceae bacterium]